MKLLFKTFMFFALVVTLSCNSNIKQPISVEDHWQYIRINDRNAVSFLIDFNNDPSEMLFYRGGGFFSKDKKVTVDTLSSSFTQAEKDSIYLLAKELISAAPKPKLFCTELTGGLELTIVNSDQLIRSIKYRSTCDWSKISPGAKQLSDILQRHVKGR